MPEDQNENLSDALLLDESQESSGERDNEMSAEDKAVYDLMDNDPDTREAIAAEMKRRLFQAGVAQNQAPAPFQAPQVSPQQEELREVRAQIDEAEKWIDGFYAKSDAEKNYAEYQSQNDKIRRLTRRETQLLTEQQHVAQALSQSGSWVDEWIESQAAAEKARSGRATIKEYAASIKQMAATLDPAIKADRARLNQVLQHLVEPNAYKQHNLSRRGGASQRQDFRRDTGGSYSEPGDESSDRRPTDEFADASPEEREFLRGVGVLKDRKEPKRDGGLIAHGDGYIIPVGRGRRNGGQ